MLVQNELVSSEPFLNVVVEDFLPPSWRRRLIEANELALAAAGTYRGGFVAFHLAPRTGLARIRLCGLR